MRNFVTSKVAEFRAIPYTIRNLRYKNIRNSVQAEFRNHPTKYKVLFLSDSLVLDVSVLWTGLGESVVCSQATSQLCTTQCFPICFYTNYLCKHGDVSSFFSMCKNKVIFIAGNKHITSALRMFILRPKMCIGPKSHRK